MARLCARFRDRPHLLRQLHEVLHVTATWRSDNASPRVSPDDWPPATMAHTFARLRPLLDGDPDLASELLEWIPRSPLAGGHANS